MNAFAVPSAHLSMGAYYPKGHLFAMFADTKAAEAAASKVSEVEGVGSVAVATPQAIIAAFSERAAEVGGMPSVGREDQFMARYVELAQSGKAGLLIEVADAAPEGLSQSLLASGAWLAYYYRALIIEELVELTLRTEGAAAGKL
ncbi:MAG: hypothetical protein I8H77_18010 [Comamonadaceae bacterium]|nr:hypothetical protein [Comamonadaceae bacterium]